MNPTDSSNSTKPGWRRRLFSAITMCLAHPWFIPFLVVVAMLLYIQALWSGFWLDDYGHRMKMLDLSPFPLNSPKIFCAYDFVSGSPEKNRLAMEIGYFPWWTASDFRMSFMRYISSASIWLDYQLWPNLPVLMHLHSLAWYGALVAAVAYFYRRVMGQGWIAGLAALLFAIDFRHTESVAWLAGRQAVISVFFGILCLIAYNAWRASGKKIHAFTAPLFLLLGLFSGETALGTAGFLFAYALFLDQGAFLRRFKALVPCAAVVGIWAIVYTAHGHGVRGSGMYTHPAETPMVFFYQLLERAPLFIMGQWTLLPSESGLFFTPAIALTIALIVTAFLCLMLFPLIRHDRMARFFTLGMAIALIPIAAVGPSNRNLLYVGFAVMPLVALFLGSIANSAEYLPESRAWRICANVFVVLLVLTHVVLSPISIPNRISTWNNIDAIFSNPARSIPNDPKLAAQTLVLVNLPDHCLSIFSLFSVRIVEGKIRPKKVRPIAASPGRIEMHRLDEYSLTVKTPAGIFNGLFRNLIQSRKNPLSAGQEYKLSDVSMRIETVDKEFGPTEVTYRYAVPLEDPSLRWLQFEDGALVPFTPPAIGKSVVLQGTDIMDILMNKKKKPVDHDI